MYKKFFCIALFLLMLVGMTCVVASEDINTDNDAIANVEDLEVQSAPIDYIDDDLSTDNDIDTISADSNNKKKDPNLDCELETTDAYVTITANVTKNATGNVAIKIKEVNDKNYKVNTTVKIKNGTAVWSEYMAFEKGDYNADITYLGDNNYFSTSKTKVFEIKKLTTDFTVRVSTSQSFVQLAAIANADATGTVTVNIKRFEEENYTEYATIDMENGIAVWQNEIVFPKGDYVVFTKYNGNDEYFPATNTQTFMIKKDRTDLNLTVTTDDSFVNLNASVNPNATGNVIIYIKNVDEENFTKYATEKIENGTAIWGEFISFKKGDYELKAEYAGDDNFFKAENTQSFTIEKEMPEINVEIIPDKQFVTIAVVVSENATGNVTIRIKTAEEENFTEYATIDLEDELAIWSDSVPFDKGDYVAFVMYNGDEKYFKAGNTQTFSIKKQMPEFDVNISVDKFLIVLNATLPENATGNVTVNIKRSDEENYTEYTILDVTNGTAIWADFAPFNKGDYVAYTKYNGDENYFDAENTQNFTIEKEFPGMIVSSNVNGTTATINITLPENATGTLSFVNNQTGEITNVTLSGTPITFIEEIGEGYNVFMIYYSGDDYYFGVANTVVETIQLETSLYTKDTINVTYLNTAKKVINLLVLNETGNPISNGETVTITVNNQTYNGTLENGTVTISILASYAKKFIPNTYIANVTFDGNDNLKNASTSFKLVVKKGTPKITASAKTFKVSTKTKKYTITLKNHKNSLMKNAKVTIKVNGKTFKATTNEKGKATFKITNLKKRAIYYALVKYNTSKYYNMVSKKVKITVKR